MGKKYTDGFDVFLDLTAYMSLRTGASLTLGLLPPVATNRYPWIIENWDTILYPIFKQSANGSSVLEKSLELFQNIVESARLGNKNNELENTNTYQTLFPLLNLIELSILNLTPNELIFRDKEIERIAGLQLEDFRNMITFLKKAGSIAAEEIGLGDETAAKYQGRSVAAKRKKATIQDLVTLEGNAESLQIIEGIIFDLQSQQRKEPNLLTLSNNSISVDSSVSFLDIYRSFVTVPFEISLEHMAQKYLGSKDLWYELVTVNKLKPPYIDESGEKFPLLSPAAVNNCIIKDTKKQDVPVGTSVGIGSYRYKEEIRIVERTIENEDGTLVLFLSGKQDLNKFTTSHKAYIRIFRPGTTRPGQYIKIPLTESSPLLSSFGTPKADELRRLDKALLNFGVDIARDERTNDILLDSNGNFKMAYGLDNVRQTVLFALKTIKKELPFHPNYGLNLNIGDRFFGTTDEALIFSELIRQSLLQDIRFLDVKIVKLASTGTSISLSLLVFIAGSSQPIPLSFAS